MPLVRDDPRVDKARLIPMREIMSRIQLPKLTRLGPELVGACPVCGGKDRFSIHLARGIFNCRRCAKGGDGIALVQHALSCDFEAAILHLCGDLVEISPEERQRRTKAVEDQKRREDVASARYRAQAIRDAVKIWARALPASGTVAQAYLELRGITLRELPKSLRFLPDHPYVKKIGRNLETLHRGPCMIAAIQGADNKLRAVHQTWIDLSNSEKGRPTIRSPKGDILNSKLVRGSKKGGAIRLGGDLRSGKITIGEGIETTLSVRMASDEPCEYWAGVDLDNMSGKMVPSGKRGTWTGEPDLEDTLALRLPPWVDDLTLIQDGDSNPEKTRANMRAAALRARYHRPDLKARIIHPGAGLDFNDLLRKGSTDK